MGSLENGLQPLKRESLLRSSPSSGRSNGNNGTFGQRPRSRFARFLLFKKLDYLQWICAVVVFIFFLFLFQMFLPLSVTEKSGDFLKEREANDSEDLLFLKEFGGLDFGEDVKFEPSKVLLKFQKENVNNMTVGSRRVLRFGFRKPQLALVFADLLVDPQQILMVTIAAALRELGYEIEVFSLEDGPVHAVWKNLGIPVNIVETNENVKIVIDWLNYDGILVNSLEARGVISSLLQEPFKSIPLIWTIHESTLAARLREYILNGQVELVDDWKVVFNRATVVLFPNYALAMFYAACDAGNYFVVPGSPAEACKPDNSMIISNDDLRVKMNFEPNDFVIAIVGSELLYKGIWLEHALVLQALSPLLADFPDDVSAASHLKIVILTRDSTGNYSVAMEEIASSLQYPKGTVNHVAINGDVDGILRAADVVVYGSFLEEKSFPDNLIKAMCLGKPILAPDISVIKKYVDDRVNGYLFPKENIQALTQIMQQLVSKGNLSPLARNIASMGKHTAKNLMVSESVAGYASVIESILRLPSEVASPKAASEIPADLKSEWQWHLFEAIEDTTYVNRTSRSYKFLTKYENERNHTHKESSPAISSDETFVYSIWEEEKNIQTMKARKRREDDELKDRTYQSRGTWEEVYRIAKKADRLKNDLHERDDGELERTGQPLCIYEPYFGQGAWPFLHRTSLYRGLGLSTKGRRPKADDIDGPSRLPLLSTPYYRDVLGEFGAFFAIANRIGRIHKNAWIGFTSWRATARKASLSKQAEIALLDAIQGRKHGDTLYFWVRMDKDPRNPLQKDFWSFCDAINAGNCKFAFSEALKKMYGIKNDLDSLPAMPADGDTWSVMHSWALPTKSFLEFVMFSRMFMDALDAQVYDEHHESGLCYLSLSKDKHCYSRVLELLVNVWAYHSARRMVYIDPSSGAMQEQHKFKSRRGQMWVKWFNYITLKTMDEELAEEMDSDRPKKRWLWPLTGEVFWQGIYEKERSQLRREKERRKQKSKDKIQRIKNRTHQKALGKYVKPPLEEDDSNSTLMVPPRLYR